MIDTITYEGLSFVLSPWGTLEHYTGKSPAGEKLIINIIDYYPSKST